MISRTTKTGQLPKANYKVLGQKRDSRGSRKSKLLVLMETVDCGPTVSTALRLLRKRKQAKRTDE
jgi:hypothetical protein